MKGKPNIKQHFIPVCYLKGFSSNEKNLFVYDKTRNKSFSSSIKKTGFKDNFYTISKKFVKEDFRSEFDSEFFETQFFAENIEKSYGLELKTIKRKAALWLSNNNENEVLTETEKRLFAGSLAIQFLRLPEIRAKFYKAHQEGEVKRLEIIKTFLISENPELRVAAENIQIRNDPEYGSVVHSWLYSNKDLVDRLANVLSKKAWAFIVSTENQLYSSDNPIVIIPRLKNESYILEGLGMKGAQIIFPITGNILLSMWDEEYFDIENYRKNQFQAMYIHHRNLNNYYQYINAKEHIYRGINDFGLIQEVLKENHGNAIYMPRPTIKVY